MARILSPGEKPLYWVGSSKDDLIEFPEPVKDSIGNALGGKHPAAKPWKGEGSGRKPLWGYLSRRVYRSIPGGGLCVACVSEEVAKWDQDRVAGCGSRGATVANGAGGLRGTIWQRRKLRWNR